MFNFKKEKIFGVFCKMMVLNRIRLNNVNVFFVNKIYKSFVLIVQFFEIGYYFFIVKSGEFFNKKKLKICKSM